MRIEDAAWICHPTHGLRYMHGEPQGVRGAACSAFEARGREVVSDDPEVQSAVTAGYLSALRTLEDETLSLRMFVAGRANLPAARLAVNRALQALDEIERAMGGRE